MKSMTYGTLPSFEEFGMAFDNECPNGTFSLTLSRADSRAADGTRIGDGNYSDIDLYTGVKELMRKWAAGGEQSEAAGDLASAILFTLGFRWV